VEEQPTPATTETSAKEQFAIQNIYIKDISFETSNAFELFAKQTRPHIETEMSHKISSLQDDSYEVILNVTVTVKIEEQTAFLVEVHQGGIFLVRGFSEPRLAYTLNSFCLGILFPYAREMISNLVVRGGFQPLYLAPINFDALYQQHLQRAQTEQSKAN